MARTRLIKPEFFKHDSLYDAEVAAGLPLRLAFAGLWVVADREGRFAWEPRRIRLEVLPYDEVDFAAVLEALAQYGFVVRYEVEGKTYGLIPSFHRHQKPHRREQASIIPAPRTDKGQSKDGTATAFSGTSRAVSDTVSDTVSESKAFAAAPRENKPRSAQKPPEGRAPKRQTWLTPFGEEWENAYGADTFPWGEAARVLKALSKKPPDERRAHMREYVTRTTAEFASLRHFASTYGGWSPAAPHNGRIPPSATAVKFMHLLKPILHLPRDAFQAEVDELVACGKVRDKARFLELANMLDFGYLRTVRTDDEAIAHIAQRINGHANGVAA